MGNGCNTLQNCYHLNNLENGSGTITENNSTSINEQQLMGKQEIAGKYFIDLLNDYVVAKDKINDIQLIKWQFLEDYPSLITDSN